MTNVLPAFSVLKLNPVVQFYVLQHRVRHVSVLIQRHVTSSPLRKITIFHSETVRYSVPIQRIVLGFCEPHFQFNRGVRFWRLAQRPDYREPIADRFAREDSLRRDGRDADQIRAEHVVVLDVELDLGDGVGERNLEMLIPFRALGVGNHARASDGSSSKADRDVRVAGDDFPVSLVVFLIRKWLAASGEELAETLGEHIHVR